MLAIVFDLRLVFSVCPPPSCAFVTFEKMESADQAVAEVSVKTLLYFHVHLFVYFYKTLTWLVDFS